MHTPIIASVEIPSTRKKARVMGGGLSGGSSGKCFDYCRSILGKHPFYIKMCFFTDRAELWHLLFQNYHSIF